MDQRLVVASPHCFCGGQRRRPSGQGLRHGLAGPATRPCTAAALALSAGLLLLPACEGNDATGTGATGTGSSSSAAASPNFSPSATVKAVGFDDTYRTDDGVAVQIIEIEETKLGPFPETEDPDAKEGDPYVIFTTETTNGTKAKVGLILTAVLKYGPERTQAAQVHLGDMESVFVLDAGEGAEYLFGFIIPGEFHNQVVMEMTVSTDPLRTAVFSGSITST